MKYNEEFLQYQKIFEKTLKRRHKSILEVIVDPEAFEIIMEEGKDYPWKTLGVQVNWSVKIAVEENESLSNLSSLGQSLFYSMFKIKGVVPWISLNTIYED